MYIIFENIKKNYFFFQFIKYFKFKIFYYNLKSENNNDVLASELKKLDILPLDLENKKKLSNAIHCESDFDSSKRNVQNVNFLYNKKIANIFLQKFKFKSNNIIKILISDYIVKYQLGINNIIKHYCFLNPSKKIIYISFRFENYFFVETKKNLFKIYVPLDFIFFIIKFFFFIIKNFFYFRTKLAKKKSSSINKNNFKIGIFLHGEKFYGSKKNIIYYKDLYYSHNINELKEKNIIHFNYLDKNLNNSHSFININKIKKISLSNIISIFLVFLRSIFFLKKFSDFILIKILLIEFKNFLSYRSILKSFKFLKLNIIDYDILCPKSLILASQSLKINTLATQERYISSFYNIFTVICDYYFTASKYSNSIIKKNKLFMAKNLISVGQYRLDKLKKCNNPKIVEIENIHDFKKKKIIVALGAHCERNWYTSSVSPLTSFKAQKYFFKDMIKLSEDLVGCFIIIRLKNLNGIYSGFLNDEHRKIRASKNIILSTFYEKPEYQYTLCSSADLVIAKHTSLLDECVAFGIPSLIYDYSHNLDSIISGAFNYGNSKIICKNYNQLLNRSEKILFQKQSSIRKDLSKIRKKFYYFNKNENVKNKIQTYIKEKLL